MGRTKKNLSAGGAGSQAESETANASKSASTDQPQSLKRGQAGGIAVREKYPPSFFAFIGRLGGRRFRYNRNRYLAEHYDVRQSEVDEYREMAAQWQRELPPQEAAERISKWNAMFREMFTETAEKYSDTVGNKIITECHSWEVAGNVPTKSKAGKRKQQTKAKKGKTKKES